MVMDKKQVADILEQMGTLLELQGANPFKIRAFHNGARLVEALTRDIHDLVEANELTSVKGIGPSLCQIITDLVRSGKNREHEVLKKSIPPGLLEMIRIQGLGPKRIKLLYEQLKIKSIAELKKACELHRLTSMDGFGAKTEANILKGIEQLSKVSNKHYYHVAQHAAAPFIKRLEGMKEVSKAAIAGSLRRRKEIIGDIDILVSASKKDRARISQMFVEHEAVERIIGQGDTKSSVLLKSGINCDLRVVNESEFPFALNYFTGSKEHNVEMRTRARKLGLSLNEYGFTSTDEKPKNKKSKLPICSDEEDIYRTLGLDYIHPELREGMGEIEAAAQGRLPNLLQQENLRGTFHCHSTFSDGSNSIEEMVLGARKCGWQYWGIADHSQVAAYARGLSPDRVKEQHREVDRLNKRYSDFRIFKGTECDILKDGTLDYSDKVLASFEYVVVSIHSSFKMTEAEATKRVIKALKNKYTTILGHPTGRLLLEREGYPLNLGEVIQVAADYGKAIEINSHPYRLDLDWRWLKFAKQKGVRIFINPDAHNVDGLADVEYGVGIARKGWLEASDVVNTWPTKKVESYLESVRR